MTALQLLNHCIIGMGPGWYHWISIKTLAGLPSGADSVRLQAIIGDMHYRDTYLTANSHELDSGTVHGPYMVGRITPESFEQVLPSEAESMIRAWADRFEVPAAHERELEAGVLTAVRTAASVYRLRALGEEAQWECGWILDDFEEVVALGMTESTATLIVMAGD